MTHKYAHCIENPIPEMKLLCLIPNSYIHVSVSDLYIPRICLPMWLKTNPGNIHMYVAQRYMNVEIRRQNILILFWK